MVVVLVCSVMLIHETFSLVIGLREKKRTAWLLVFSRWHWLILFLSYFFFQQKDPFWHRRASQRNPLKRETVRRVGVRYQNVGKMVSSRTGICRRNSRHSNIYYSLEQRERWDDKEPQFSVYCSCTEYLCRPMLVRNNPGSVPSLDQHLFNFFFVLRRRSTEFDTFWKIGVGFIWVHEGRGEGFKNWLVPSQRKKKIGE